MMRSERGATPAHADLASAKAALLERWRAGAVVKERSGIRPRRRGEAVLSLAQKRIWFLEQFQPGTPVHNLAYCGEIDAAIDAAALAGAVDDLVARHESLRVTLRSDRGVPELRIDKGTSPALEVLDLRAGEPDAARERALGAVRERAAAPFDLEKGPLARLVLLRLPGTSLFEIVVHHLVGDGWSLGVAMREIAELYAARLERRPARLAPLEIQYTDFAHWQSTSAPDGTWEADRRYWLARLADRVDLELPTDRPRPPVRTFAGDWIDLSLPRALSERVRALAREVGGSPFMVLLAALQIVLARWSGASRVAVGSPVAGRDRPEVQGLIGNFINTVVLDTDLAGDPTLRQVLARVRDTALGALAHASLPFERLVESLHPSRDPSRSALFQVLLVVQPPLPEFRLGGRPFRRLEVGVGAVRADLELHLWDEESIGGRLEFDAALFDASTARRLAAHLGGALEALLDAPDLRLSAWSPLSLPEEERLRARGTGPILREEAPPVLRQIEAVAAGSPGATAVIDAEGAWSYRELDARANRIAAALQALRVGREARVALCVPRSFDLIAALLGIWKAGAAYVPIDARHPAERREMVIADAEPAAMIVARADSWVPAGVPRLALAEPGAATVAPERVEIHPEAAAYLLHTSGSTGRPKGVVVPHRALANFLASMASCPGLGSGERLLALTTLCFDIAALEVYLPLSRGEAVVLASEEDARDPARLRALAARHGATVLQATPTSWRMMLSDPAWDATSLRALCGGEALPPDLAQQLTVRCAEAFQLYGPTETTVWSSVERLAADAVVGLGEPIRNTTLSVRDARLRRLPIGLVGEICIGGDGVARGYWGRPDSTAERFVPDPDGLKPGARMYRTGDLGLVGADGSLRFVGRTDQQIKLRGHRIELGEIEALLASHAGVEHAAATLRGEGPDAAIVAYVVPDAELLAARERATGSWTERRAQAPVASDAASAPGSAALARWLASRTPRQILEIGCCNGPLLRSFAPEGVVYCGVDWSSARIAALLDDPALPRTPRMSFELAASESPRWERRYDVVLVNDLARSSTRIEELADLLGRAVDATVEGGAVYVTRLASLPGRRGAEIAKLLERARPGASPGALAWALDERLAAHAELAVDPRWPHRFAERHPRVSSVEVHLPDPSNPGELAAVFHVAGPPPPHALVLGGRGRGLEAPRLHALLEREGADALVVEHVSIHPSEERIAAFLGEAPAPQLAGGDGGAPAPGVDWDELRQRLEACGPWTLELRADRGDERGRVDVVVRRRGSVGPRLTPPGGSAPDAGPAARPAAAAARQELARELRAWLRERLPEPMVPAAVVPVRSLPQTAHGKLDRRALGALDPGRAAASRHVSPRTALEAEIAELEAVLLGVERVGVGDDFFELGGHSLLAAQLVATIRERHGVELPVQALFVSPTVEHLARLVEEERLRKQRHLGGGAGRVRALVEELSDRDVERMLLGLVSAGAAR